MSEESLSPAAVIGLRLECESDYLVDIWRFCVNQWLAQEVVEPEDFYTTQGVEEEDVGPVESDEYDEDDDEMPVIEPELDDELSPEIREALAMNKPYLDALRQFWLEMNIFNTEQPNIPNWNGIINQVQMAVKHVPSDPGKLIDHVLRLNDARIQAEGMVPKQTPVQAGTPLYDILNNRF